MPLKVIQTNILAHVDVFALLYVYIFSVVFLRIILFEPSLKVLNQPTIIHVQGEHILLIAAFCKNINFRNFVV
jgi:hypothetical protein